MQELKESELGTQKYWDERYKTEIENFENHGDPGEIWFGEDAVERILKWMDKHRIPKNWRFLDLGCGNGLFLVELANQGYTNLWGVDYSKDAIILAKSIAQKRNLSINYSTGDVTQNLEGKFDVIHDKGTYDAISLNSNIGEYRKNYLDNIFQALNPSGLFIITSCNWTKNELNEHFKNYFQCSDAIPTPQFQFGGKTGNTVTSLIYKKL